MKRKFGFKNSAYNEKLNSIPNNFAVKNEDGSKEAEIIIYGEIGDTWFEDSTSAIDVDNALKEIGDKDVIVRLNSPGGSAFDGVSIYNRLKQHKGKVTVYVDGYACSSASIIAMAGDEVVMGEGSMLMIHEASTVAWGSKGDFRSTADMLEELESGIIDIYMNKAKVSREEITDMVNAETWMSSKKAIEVGLADKLISSTVDDNKEIENLKETIFNMQKQLETLTLSTNVLENNKEETKPKKLRRFL